MRGQPPPPYVLEDLTGDYTATDWDDIYDRLFLRVAPAPDASRQVLMLFNMGRRAHTRTPDHRHLERRPVVVLDFTPAEALGTVTFVRGAGTVAMPMHKWLRKTSIFGGSLSRRFKGSDGRDYRWAYRVVEGQEWTCLTVDDRIVAHYVLKPPHVPSLDGAGHMLTVLEPYAGLIYEFVASFTVMRHIYHRNL